jgi:hypothetical protein
MSEELQEWIDGIFDLYNQGLITAEEWASKCQSKCIEYGTTWEAYQQWEEGLNGN